MPLAGRRKPAVTPLGAINLTPMLDVMCNLLIVFMMVAPALKSGLKIDLPQVTDTKIITPRKFYTISIAKPESPEGQPRIYLDNRRLDLETLRTEMENIKAKLGNEVDIIIECDRTVPTETMLKVLGITQAAGLESVGVITIQEPGKK